MKRGGSASVLPTWVVRTDVPPEGSTPTFGTLAQASVWARSREEESRSSDWRDWLCEPIARRFGAAGQACRQVASPKGSAASLRTCARTSVPGHLGEGTGEGC